MSISASFLLVALTCFCAEVKGHGRLMEPPSRSSLFRFENTDPAIIPYKDIIQPNYDDNELNCGGRQVQINNDGMCGVCGDPYNVPVKENEAGGKYALGIITRKYTTGQVIDVSVEITAEHKGYFEFRLCPWNDVNTPITHECLDQHPLSYENGETKWYLPENHDEAQGFQYMRLRLPDGITCDQCVLQWRYRTGNSWGYENGQQGLGLGQQEEFYGCCDVAISDLGLPPNNSVSTTSHVLPPSSSYATEPAQAASTEQTTAAAGSEQSTQSISSTSTMTTTIAATTTTPERKTTTKTANEYPKIDCKDQVMGMPIFRDCHSFYICAFPAYDPFIFACPPGTVCDPRNGRCDYSYNVPPPCNAMQ